MKEETVTERRKIENKKQSVPKLFLAYPFQFFYPDRNLGGKIISQAA